MRRVALIVALLIAGPAAFVVGSAGADDARTYNIELDNAFGLVPGSEVRIAGVAAGTVQDFDVNERKKAVAEIEVSGPLSTFYEDATCSSEPQSLIAEYFLDCQPGNQGEELEDGGLIPVHSEEYGDQTFTTVQQDLVQNTLREPFRQRFGLILNEFGTALAGNPDELNAAIRRGAPALRALDEALAILARQNRVITQLNVDSDVILARLVERRDDVVRFVQNANRTAAASAERRADLSRDFELLPGFLAELRPTLARLGETADQSTPLLADLQGAAGQLNRLTTTLPAFNAATKPSLEALGEAAVKGRRALREGRNEITALRRATPKAYTALDQTANFLVDLDNPARAVERDRRAAAETGRPYPTGYTGFEGLINYFFGLTRATNQFDQVGHLLHFLLTTGVGATPNLTPCGEFNAGSTVPARGGGETTKASERDPCVAWLGPNQPGINELRNLPPYDPSVCPNGSASPELCNPNARQDLAARTVSATNDAVASPTREAPGLPSTGPPTGPDQTAPGETLPGLNDLGQGLDELLGLDSGQGGGLGDLLGLGGSGRGGQGLGGPLGLGGESRAATNDLLNFLFGN
jgi:virulence factor Mce-like protein